MPHHTPPLPARQPPAPSTPPAPAPPPLFWEQLAPSLRQQALVVLSQMLLQTEQAEAGHDTPD
jgi:hypothetical protein